IGVATGEARVDVPAGVAGILLAREADDGEAEAAARLPASGADQRVERRVQRRGVRSAPERLVDAIREPHDGPRPGRGLRTRAAEALEVAPEQRAALLRQRARDRVVEPHEAVRDEALDLFGIEHAHTSLVPFADGARKPRHAPLRRCHQVSTHGRFLPEPGARGAGGGTERSALATRARDSAGSITSSISKWLAVLIALPRS